MRIRPLPLVICSLSVALTAGIRLAQAEEPPASTASATASQSQETVPPAVEVKALRDPAIMPYKQAYEMLTSIQKATQDKVKVLVRVTAKTQKTIPDLHIRLESNETRLPVPVSENGIVDIPLSAKAYAEGAEFVTNQKKSTLSAHITLIPNLPANGFQASEVQDSLNASIKAMREFVPWYYRIFIPNPKGVAVCYDNPQQQIVLRGQQEKVISASEKMDNPYGASWYCGKLMARELENEHILPASGYHLLYL